MSTATQLFLLEKVTYDRNKSTVNVNWLTKTTENEQVSYPNHSFGGSFVPSDNFIEAMDALKSTVAQLMGTDRDIKMVLSGDLAKKTADLVTANYNTHLQDITIKGITIKYNGDEMQTVTITFYLRGPLGRGSAGNYSVKVSEDSLGIEEEIKAKVEYFAAEAAGFVESHGQTQLNIYSEPDSAEN